MSNIEQVSVDAAQRWQAAAPAIAQTLRFGPAVEPIERKQAYLDHQLKTGEGAKLWAGAGAPRNLFDQFGTERVIGSNDLLSFDTLQKAIAIGRFVGQVCLRDTSSIAAARLTPIATASMVSPRLLLTNHHVLGSRDEAAAAVVRFDYQIGEEGKPLAASVFALDPEEFFVTDEVLDYTLVAVAPTAQEGTPLAHFGWNHLNGAQGKILRGYPVNIIQHPEGDYKQIVLSNNKVLDLVDHYFLYQADTLPGSSGAPVFNRQWEVVALHRRGVPRVVDGVALTKGGQAWHEGIPRSEIDWIGNEGTRVSSLVQSLQRAPLARHQAALLRELVELPAPQPFLVARMARGAAGVESGAGAVGTAGRLAVPAAIGSSSVAINVTLRLTVSIGAVTVERGPG